MKARPGCSPAARNGPEDSSFSSQKKRRSAKKKKKKRGEGQANSFSRSPEWLLAVLVDVLAPGCGGHPWSQQTYGKKKRKEKKREGKEYGLFPT